jgi:tRNA1(Val) A37 N6-methylase TrmN6
LNGRVAYRQLQNGHRSGFEPVLLAATVPARTGQIVVELGCGAGAGLLCLGARVSGLTGHGIEQHEALVDLANENFKNNGLHDFFAKKGEATALPFGADVCHHIMANPPWFDDASTPSPDNAKTLAHHIAQGGIAAWIGEMLRILRTRGTISLILPANRFSEAARALNGPCGGITLLPLWPRAGQRAKMVLIRARKGSREPDEILPGLVLHNETGLTPEAEAVLRFGAALEPSSFR